MLIHCFLQQFNDKKKQKESRDQLYHYFFKPYTDYKDVIHTVLGFEGLVSDTINGLPILLGFLKDLFFALCHLIQSFFMFNSQKITEATQTFFQLLFTSIMIFCLTLLSPILDFFRIFTRWGASSNLFELHATPSNTLAPST